MRQLTKLKESEVFIVFSKLPMRQLTVASLRIVPADISKLPMRQLTGPGSVEFGMRFSKLPMRQLTMPERKKNPTARALIHLFSTLTQIYSCFEIY